MAVALMVDVAEQIRRFRERPRTGPADDQIGWYIADRGGDKLLHRIHQHFTAYLDQRRLARRLATDGAGVGATYDALVGLLGR